MKKMQESQKALKLPLPKTEFVTKRYICQLANLLAVCRYYVDYMNNGV